MKKAEGREPENSYFNIYETTVTVNLSNKKTVLEEFSLK